jgi:hypothetical protein
MKQDTVRLSKVFSAVISNNFKVRGGNYERKLYGL